MKWNKTVLLSTAALLSALWYAGGSAHASAQETDVKVQVNSALVSFPDAKPFIDENNMLQVPLRFVAEKLGNQVDWSFEGQEVRVTLKGDGKTLNMKTGEQQATVNGEKVSFGTKAIFHEGRTYVPLRFVTETFGSRIQWDEQNQIAIIDADGQFHAPAWYKPKPQVMIAKAPEAVPVVTQIINDAKNLLGIPYVWGGETPDGFDCSGFVNYVYGPKGVWLPRTSLEMYYTGTAVTNLQPGDLVFFSINKKKASHVGIYIGNNQFISATTSRGINIDSLSSSYWSSKYIGARRVI